MPPNAIPVYVGLFDNNVRLIWIIPVYKGVNVWLYVSYPDLLASIVTGSFAPNNADVA